MAQHQADAKRMLDDRGYHGVLIRGQNPLLLFEKAVRDRITDSYYWKEQCFGLNAATLLDRAVEITCIGGTYGTSQKPTPFLCLAFKMLQLTPEKEIVRYYLEQGGEEWKYLRALAAFYVRLTWEPKEIFETLEPFLADSRKLKRRTREGFTLSYVDQFVDDLLIKDRVCATSLWKMPTRTQLEDLDVLEARVSPLGDEIEELDMDDDDGEVEEVGRNGHESSMSRSRSRSASRDRRYGDSRNSSRDRYRDSRSRSRSRSPSRDRYRGSRSRTPPRYRDSRSRSRTFRSRSRSDSRS